MVKGKVWAAETLQAIGGASAIEVVFFEEMLGAHTAQARLRLHRQAAGAVLQSLLPADMKRLEAPGSDPAE